MGVIRRTTLCISPEDSYPELAIRSAAYLRNAMSIMELTISNSRWSCGCNAQVHFEVEVRLAAWHLMPRDVFDDAAAVSTGSASCIIRSRECRIHQTRLEETNSRVIAMRHGVGRGQGEECCMGEESDEVILSVTGPAKEMGLEADDRSKRLQERFSHVGAAGVNSIISQSRCSWPSQVQGAAFLTTASSCVRPPSFLGSSCRFAFLFLPPTPSSREAAPGKPHAPSSFIAAVWLAGSNRRVAWQFDIDIPCFEPSIPNIWPRAFPVWLLHPRRQSIVTRRRSSTRSVFPYRLPRNNQTADYRGPADVDAHLHEFEWCSLRVPPRIIMADANTTPATTSASAVDAVDTALSSARMSPTEPPPRAPTGEPLAASASAETPSQSPAKIDRDRPVSAELKSNSSSRQTSPKISKEPSRAASPSSSSSSQKEDQTTDANSAPVYGTRSRKSGARVNYADDDYEFEMAVTKVDDASKRSTPADATKARPSVEGTRPAQTIRLTTSAPNGASSASVSGNEKNTSPSGAQPPERKKRKYERHNQKAAPSPDARIPGTSQFFASPSAAEQPSGKRRKTGDGSSPNGDSGAITRKQSSHSSSKLEGRTSQIVTFARTGAGLKDGKLYADDGDIYSVDDTVFLICEPPGDPYYLCRIMEFRRDDPDNPDSPVTSMLVNWFYRPKDIGRYSADPRYLFGSMQSDESPITSLRGKCKITHKSDIFNLDEYRKQPDSFWFNQLYDRYIMRPYEIIPTANVINVPEKVKRALDEKWKYVVVEPARMKELTAAIKLCKRCQTYCAPSNSVDCGVCHNTYHMACVRPALTKKPSRGFAWSCGPCSRAQERRLEQRTNGTVPEDGEEEPVEDDEEEANKTTVPSPQDADMLDAPASELDTAHADLWPWRYLGIHCKVEDVLQYDDRAIYPRASSRLGPRHQANVILWPGRPVELVKSAEIRKKYGKQGTAKNLPKPSKDAQVATDSDHVKATRPRWVQDAPQGYIPRGEDIENGDKNCTATKLFILPDDRAQQSTKFATVNGQNDSTEKLLDEYMAEVDQVADGYGQVKPFEKVINHERTSIRQVSSNYLDQALKLFQKHAFDKSAALAELKSKHSPKDLGNPELTKEELKKFEDGIVKHGTDFRMVRKGVKGRSTGEIVRFYYGWKSTKRGQEVRDRHEGRRGAKKGRAEASWTEIADEEDDSAFDGGKAEKHKRRFQCKFCSIQHARQWRRAPNVAPGQVTLLDPKGSNKDKSNQLVVALCNRCAIMWRRYGMRFEDPEEVAKSISQSGGRAWKRKTDEELLREIVYANEAARVGTPPLAAQAAAAMGMTITVPWEISRKKAKSADGKESTPVPGGLKKQQPPAPPPRPPTPPIVPQEARMRDLPCAVCRHGGVGDDEKIFCNDCRLTVHRRCYAVPEAVSADSWICDTCANDRNPQEYTCCLCNKDVPPLELIEQPKPSHKKKTERDREKENLERDLRVKLHDQYVKDQRAKGKPVQPREALKKTASNNWMHIMCAVFTPEIKFSDPMAMDGIEGLGAVASNPARADNDCKICNVKDSGFCVPCHQCHKAFHVSCAHDADYLMGFDVAPVKGSRKDVIQTVTFQAETGLLTAAIWCKDHQPKTMVHDMTEPTEDGIIALQAFVRKYKAADLTLTGTARKANLLGQSTKAVASTSVRRTSLLTNGNAPSKVRDTNGVSSNGHHLDAHKCVQCRTDSTLKWYPQTPHPAGVTNGILPDVESVKCHKCHVRAINGEEATRPPKTEDSLSSPVPQPDYFGQLTIGQRPPMIPNTTWTAGHAPLHAQHPASVGMQVSPEDWARGLFETTITLVNVHKGGQHVFQGRDFNIQLDGDPTPGFRYLQHYATQHCNYDPARYTILSDEGQVIDSPGRFTAALANLLIQRPGRKHVTWRLVDSRDLMYSAPQPFPPQMSPLHSGPHQAPPVGHHQLASVAPVIRNGATYQLPPRTPPGGYYSTPGYKYPPGPGGQGMAPPPLVNGTTSYPRPLSTQDAVSSANQGPALHQSPQRPTAVASERGGPVPAYAGSPAAPRASTPREMQTTASVGGASSSPNLRNLMH
ncbi:hypothetical protein FH972_026012 [Carpinus fangiana]|uniref:Uncharacterized protein n=1 Tax=Carpinus fangiana TaxID=176857 RepID=A0A5N6L2P8_9ROSI|nr:hypothetical protein FH972_026012 [Carpinus fangiana]KAB8621902.1 hypothetical protein FH972_026012 [Carpinus fangiana]KAB8621903.1 hypothetical protein FH972_026012 [Carpinus fangiana]